MTCGKHSLLCRSSRSLKQASSHQWQEYSLGTNLRKKSQAVTLLEAHVFRGHVCSIELRFSHESDCFDETKTCLKHGIWSANLILNQLGRWLIAQETDRSNHHRSKRKKLQQDRGNLSKCYTRRVRIFIFAICYISIVRTYEVDTERISLLQSLPIFNHQWSLRRNAALVTSMVALDKCKTYGCLATLNSHCSKVCTCHRHLLQQNPQRVAKRNLQLMP